MTEDVILNLTADFILDNKSNLELGLQVERAMPHVREQLVRAALKGVEECFPQTEWSIDRSKMLEVMAKQASLVLRRKTWITNQNNPTIWLGTDRPCWKSVWVGFYFTKRSSRSIQPLEQTMAFLAASGYDVDTPKDQEGAYKYFDGELSDWSGEQFLTRILDEGPSQIASEISAELKQIDEFVGPLN